MSKCGGEEEGEANVPFEQPTFQPLIPPGNPTPIFPLHDYFAKFQYASRKNKSTTEKNENIA